MGILSEALEAALKGGEKASVLRPAEKELIARGAAKDLPAGAAPRVTPQPPDINIKPDLTAPRAPKVPPVGADPSAPVEANAPPQAAQQPPDPATVNPQQAADSAAARPGTGDPTAVNNDLQPTSKQPPPVNPKTPTMAPDGVPTPARPDPAPGGQIPAQSVQPPPVAPPVPPPSDLDKAAANFARMSIGNLSIEAEHMPNFNTMNTTDDIKAVIGSTVNDNLDRIMAAKGPKMTFQVLQRFADDAGTTPDTIRQVMERETGQALNGTTLAKAYSVWVSSGSRLKALADKYSSGMSNDFEKAEFARQIQFHNEFTSQFLGARAEAGRALNALRLPAKDDMFASQRINEILQQSGVDLDKVANAMSQADTPAGVREIAAGAFGGPIKRALMGTNDLINRTFINGILSSPATHIKNLVGNTLFTAMNAGETQIAALVGKFLPGAEHVQAGEAMATLKGNLDAVSDAWRLGWKALKTGKTMDDTLKFQTGPAGRPSSMTGWAMGQPGSGVQIPDKPLLSSVLNGIDTFIGLPNRALGASDEVFKVLAYRGEVQRQAFLAVQDQLNSGALKGQDAAQFAKDFMENAGPEVQQAAEARAQQMTFQAPLGPAGEAFTTAIRKVPGLSLIAPFIRTPVNIFKEALARGPLAVMTPRFWAAMKAGGTDRDLAITRFAMGTMTSAMVAKKVIDGDMTGGGPQEPKARALWMQNHQPYSARITNPMTGDVSWHSYAAMEPVASVLGATADATEIASYLNSDPEQLAAIGDDSPHWKAAAAIVAGVINNTGNKTFMQGMANFSQLWDDPQRQIQAYTSSMVASMEPYSGMQKFIRNEQDPYLREAWSIIDKLKDQTPGYSKDLPPRLDLFGDMREKRSGSLLGAMSPIPDKPENYDDVTKELVSVMNETHDVPVTMPEKRMDGMRLNSHEYADFVYRARAEPAEDGKTFHDALEDNIASDVYQTATPVMRSDLLKRVQHRYDSIGRAKMMNEETGNQDLRERLADWNQQVGRAKFGEDYQQ